MIDIIVVFIGIISIILIKDVRMKAITSLILILFILVNPQISILINCEETTSLTSTLSNCLININQSAFSYIAIGIMLFMLLLDKVLFSIRT